MPRVATKKPAKKTAKAAAAAAPVVEAPAETATVETPPPPAPALAPKGNSFRPPKETVAKPPAVKEHVVKESVKAPELPFEKPEAEIPVSEDGAASEPPQISRLRPPSTPVEPTEESRYEERRTGYQRDKLPRH
jgi:hypothetical protein